MTRNGGNKKKSATPASANTTNNRSNKNATTAVELKDVKFEMERPLQSTPSSTSTTSNAPTTLSASGKLEKILSKLENGPTDEKEAGYLRKKMASLGFESGIQLSNGGAFRDARKLLDGFPGDDDYELTFEQVDGSSASESDYDEDCKPEEELEEFKKEFRNMNEKIMKHLMEEGGPIDPGFRLEDDYLFAPSDVSDDDDEEDSSETDNEQRNGLLLGLDPLKALSCSSTRSGKSYPLIDPMKLQVIQSAESELTSVHDLFESRSLSAVQKLPLLKRKYMELMQQDIRHRLESLRVRDYLDTLHLERQVVERELEKAVNLRNSMEQLCERLQNENSRIRAEKAGISSKLFNDLELKALEICDEEESTAIKATTTTTNVNKTSKKKNNAKNNNNNNNQKSNTTTVKNSTTRSLPGGGCLPEALRSVSYEIPDANRLLEGAQGDLRARFKLLIDLYNQREGHFLAVLKAKDAEIQLLQGHYYTQLCQLQRVDEANRTLSGRVCDLSTSESDLRSQLSVYVDKFKQVEDTLTKSNDLFATFRHEMEQMTQKLLRLERENQSFQAKCTTLSRNIIEMADERSKQASLIEQLKGQKGKLENLCRSMQAERDAAVNAKPSTIIN